jgi:hypothetical protein
MRKIFMHLILACIILVVAYFKGDWKNGQKYGLTVYYVITSNLLYNVLCGDYLLWKYNADYLSNSRVMVELLYTFLILPSITIIYLSYYPFNQKGMRQLGFIILFVIGSQAVMYPFYVMEKIVFQNGYHYWMDFLFYFVMYSMIRLHFTRPFLTYGVSVFIIIFLVQYFHVPIK